MGGRLLGVDGIRGVAAAAIVCWHTYIYGSVKGAPDFGWTSRYIIPQLQLSLWIFFALSAFLLYRPFATAVLEERPLPNLRRYFQGRAMRILPGYWVILIAVTFIFGATTYRADGGGLGFHFPSWLAEMFFVHSYHPSSVLIGIAPTWSLSVEIVFYLLLPALGALAVAVGRRAKTHRGRLVAALVPAALLFTLGVCMRELGHQVFFDPSDPAGYRGTWFAVFERSFLVQCDLFTFGFILCVLKIEQDRGRLTLPSGWRAACVGGGMAIALPLILMQRDGQLPTYRYATWFGLISGMFIAAVVLVPRAGAAKDRLIRFLEWRPVRWSGEISYSVFLWHYPMIIMLRKWELGLDGRAGYLANIAMVAGATWVLSSITFWFVERPMMERKARRPDSRTVAGTPAQAPAAP